MAFGSAKSDISTQILGMLEVAESDFTTLLAESEVKRVEMSLLNYKEDHETTSKELDAVLKYLDELKPQCETKVMTYAERKARREEEISGLKEALEILSSV